MILLFYKWNGKSMKTVLFHWIIVTLVTSYQFNIVYSIKNR